MKQITLLFFLALTLYSSHAQDLHITEIMYNPNNSDSAWEWVEVYNAGTEPIDLTGYVIDDNSGAAYRQANIASGILLSGHSAILFNASALSENEFLKVWGTVELIPVTRWSALNNGGDTIGIWNSFEAYSGDNSSQENVIEQVRYLADGEIWPEDDGAASIFLTDLDSDNNVGTNWSLSTVSAMTPLFKTYTSMVFETNDGQDIGSPGLPSSADTENPIITCPKDVNMVSDEDNCGALLSLLLPTATDNVSTQLQFTGLRNDGLELTDAFPVGETTITWTATDEAGNISDGCSQTITITDEVPPLLNCPEGIMVSSEDGNPVTIEIEFATASNSCDGELNLSFKRSDDLGLQEAYPIGMTTITWKALDASNNMSECEQLITVNASASTENEITSFSIAEQLGQSEIDVENKIVTIKVPFGTDITALIPVIEISDDATIFPETGVAQDFTNAMSYEVMAQDGTKQIWTVTVEKEKDVTKPEIDCPVDIVVQNDDGKCGAVVDFAISFSDDDPDTTLQFSMESGSLFPVGTSMVEVIATDSAGNSNACSFNVIVKDNTPPILLCKNMSVQLDSDGSASILTTNIYDEVSDNCEIDTLTASKLSFSEANLGENEIMVTATDVNGNETSCTALVTIFPFQDAVLSINSFTLINADTNEDLFQLNEGMRINSKNLPTLNLDIRANASENVESVHLSLQGTQEISRTENVSPYALFGDSPTGDYIGNDFIAGIYTLTAEPHSADNATGDKGEVLTVNFEIFEEPLPSVTGFVLVNADTNEDLFPIIEDMQIDISSLPTLNLDIRANTNGGVESVKLQLEGNMEITRKENFAPYALYGDSPVGMYNGATFSTGMYKILAFPFTEDGLGGEMGSSLAVNFELIDSTPILSITGFTLVNADTNEDITDLTDGMQIDLSSLPTLNLNIRANTTDDVESVGLTLSGEQTASSIENVAPYAMFGDFPVGDYKGNNFEIGNYRITASGYAEDNQGEEMGESHSIGFELIGIQQSATQAIQMSVYPNPARTETRLKFNTAVELEEIHIYDFNGRLLESFYAKEILIDDSYVLPVSGLQPGNYIVRSQDTFGNFRQGQLIISN